MGMCAQGGGNPGLSEVLLKLNKAERNTGSQQSEPEMRGAQLIG